MSTDETDVVVSLDEENEAFPERSPLEGQVVPEPFVPLGFVDVVLVLPSTHPVVVLEEFEEPHRQLRIPIGVSEGMAIAYGARKIVTPKPLTHELLGDTLAALGATLEVVRLTKVEGNSYSAEMVLSSPSGSRVLVCRPSDGIALALRQDVPTPIVAAPAVLDQAGFTPTAD